MSGRVCLPELEKKPAFAFFYLQECDDLLSALCTCEGALKEIILRLANDGDEPVHPLAILHLQTSLQVVFCRIIETLVRHGFDSEEYRSLISNELAMTAIESQCQRPPVLDSRLFASDSVLRSLFHHSVFFDKALWTAILSHPNLMEYCRDLLNAYTSWCHLGKGLKKDAFSEEYTVFHSIYPHVFFSFLMVSNSRPDHKSIYTIYKLLRLDPQLGLDMALWLQRKASLKLHELLGLTAFFPYGTIRPVLVYYLLVNNKLNEQEKQTLRGIISQSSNLQRQQEISRTGKEYVEKMPFNMRTELLIMEHLSNAA